MDFTVWTLLCGLYCVDFTLLTLLCGLYCVDFTVWTSLCGLYSVDLVYSSKFRYLCVFSVDIKICFS